MVLVRGGRLSRPAAAAVAVVRTRTARVARREFRLRVKCIVAFHVVLVESRGAAVLILEWTWKNLSAVRRRRQSNHRWRSTQEHAECLFAMSNGHLLPIGRPRRQRGEIEGIGSFLQDRNVQLDAALHLSVRARVRGQE